MASLGEKILFADADGSTDFEAVNRFEEIINESDKDVLICGSRCHLQNDSESVVKVQESAVCLFIRFTDFIRDQYSGYFL